MNLREFVSTVMVELVGGVSDAQEQLGHETAQVVPRGEYSPAKPQDVQFEVAVIVSEDKGAGAGLRVAFLGMDAGGEIGGSSSREMFSQVRFSVPLALPTVPEFEPPKRPDPPPLSYDIPGAV